MKSGIKGGSEGATQEEEDVRLSLKPPIANHVIQFNENHFKMDFLVLIVR